MKKKELFVKSTKEGPSMEFGGVVDSKVVMNRRGKKKKSCVACETC